MFCAVESLLERPQILQYFDLQRVEEPMCAALQHKICDSARQKTVTLRIEERY